MTPTTAVRMVLSVMALVAAIGGVDAARAGSLDLAAIFGVLVLGLLWMLVRTSVRRPLVPVRADLVRWMARRAAVSGEATSAVADRAVAAYRSGLTEEGERDEITSRS